MNTQKLISPSSLVIHLVLVTCFLIYARIFGPPQPERIKIPYQELKQGSQKLQNPKAASVIPLDRSVLLTETRPGSMSHKSFYAEDQKSLAD